MAYMKQKFIPGVVLAAGWNSSVRHRSLGKGDCVPSPLPISFLALCMQDTDSTQQHWPFPHGKWETGYAYIMTHPGMPTVM